MSIDDAVATALEQNLDLQVQRINPQLRDLTIALFKATYTPNFTSTRQPRRPDAAAIELAVGQHQPADHRPDRRSTSASRS